MDIFKIFKGQKNTKQPEPEVKKTPLFKGLDENLAHIREALGNANDLLIREFTLKGAGNRKGAALGIDGIIDTNQAEAFVVKIMMVDLSIIEDEDEAFRSQHIFQMLFESRISMMDAKTAGTFEELYQNLINGHIIVLIDEVPQLMMFDCKGWQMRSISEPQTEVSIRGPKDSFVETIRVNTAQIRRRVKDPRLRFDSHVVGEITQTDVFVAYIDGIVNPEFVKIANDRIEELEIDGIVDASQLMEYIEDHHVTIFPRLVESERPDKVAAALMEGGVAILVDGSPFAILGPIHFATMFQSVDDYYARPVIATFQRLIRYFAFLLVVLVPGLYIAISTFHQEMVPTVLLITIINQRSSNPFPTFIETLIILGLFEIIREASVRKPQAIGDSMTIVGSLIIGQTIVQAGLVSYMVIIIGSITAIASFILSGSRLNNATRILSFIFMIIGAAFGLYGITLGFLFMVLHLCSLTSFNQPFMAPIAPFNLHDQEDQFIRFPLSWMKYRPKISRSFNEIRHNLSKPKRKEE